MSTTLQAAVLVAMMRLPCPAEEPAEECRPWRTTVSIAIADVAETMTCEGKPADCVREWSGPADELAAMLVEIAYHESGLRRRIQEGRCRDDECDAVRSLRTKRWTGKHLARSMWQLHRTPEIPGIEALVSRERWLASVGAEPAAIRLAATTAARVLRESPASFGGVSITSPGPRGHKARAILARIRAAREN